MAVLLAVALPAFKSISVLVTTERPVKRRTRTESAPPSVRFEEPTTDFNECDSTSTPIKRSKVRPNLRDLLDG